MLRFAGDYDMRPTVYPGYLHVAVLSATALKASLAGRLYPP